MENTMINVTDVLSMDYETKIQQVQIRQKLRDKMVGQLYPAILTDEIIQIQKSM